MSVAGAAPVTDGAGAVRRAERRFAGPLAISAAGLEFQNPLLLAAGTAAYGREVADVIDIERLGGIVTKAVSLEPRPGAPPPRVAEFHGGMVNAVGLANPGVDEVLRAELPWLHANVRRARVLANVVGFAVPDFAAVVARLEAAPGVHGYELNVSCPNVKAGGLEFGADARALEEVVRRARAETARPLFVKLSPTLPDIVASAQAAVNAGADALTLVNTLPGLVIDVEGRRPAIGFGAGGMSGPALMPAAVLATWRVSRAVRVPVVGVGGVATARDALQFLLAGASLVAMGTAAMRDPRAPERLLRDLARWCERHRVRALGEVVGTLEWPS